MEDRKRSADAKGFVQHVIPRKTSRKGNPYYTFQLQTSPEKIEKIVGYSSAKYEALQRFQECRSPIKIKRLNASDNASILNHESVVTKLNQYDINFKYRQVERTEDSNIPTVSSLVKISELNECEVAMGTFFSVNAKLIVGDEPMKMVRTRYGKESEVKEDCWLEDESGSISFHIWDDLFKILKGDTSYYFENLQLKKFKAEKYLSSTSKTNKTELETNIDLPASTTVDKKSVEMEIERFESMWRKQKFTIFAENVNAQL